MITGAILGDAIAILEQAAGACSGMPKRREK